MELLDRYLAAVKKHLPWQRQDDIIAELRVNLESQLDDKEAELGRPLTAPEVEAWLKQMGPPMQVAARYQPQQYLIGPGLFPTYWYVLRMAFGWAVLIYTIVSAVQIATAGAPSPADALAAILRVPWVLMTVAAWVTLVFAAIEFAMRHCPEKLPAIAGISADWNPSTLPPVEATIAGGKKRRTFAQAVAEVVFGFLALVWILLIPSHPYLLFGPGWLYLRTLPYQLAPVWVQFYCWIVGLNLLQLGWRFVDLLNGSWRRPHPAQHIAVKIMGLIPLVVLLTVKNQALVNLKNPALDQARYGATLDTINFYTHKAFLIIFVITVLQLAWDIWQLGREAMRKRLAAR
jgi:hypothetical protein